MLNKYTKNSKNENFVRIIRDNDTHQDYMDLLNDNPSSNFSGFYTALVPYSDLMSILLIFFVLFYVSVLSNNKIMKMHEDGIKDTRSQQLKDNEVVVNSDEYDSVKHLNEQKIMLSGEFLFDSGSAVLKPQSYLKLNEISLKIKKIISDGGEWNILIEGHTDNVPIKNSKYGSNWELSSARAISIVRYFTDKNLFMPYQLKTVGCGEYKPLYPNNSEENKRLNRRVEIKLTKKRS